MSENQDAEDAAGQPAQPPPEPQAGAADELAGAEALALPEELA